MGGLSKKRETPQNGWFIMENLVKIRMIWGYPFFGGKHPYDEIPTTPEITCRISYQLQSNESYTLSFLTKQRREKSLSQEPTFNTRPPPLNLPSPQPSKTLGGRCFRSLDAKDKISRSWPNGCKALGAISPERIWQAQKKQIENLVAFFSRLGFHKPQFNQANLGKIKRFAALAVWKNG